jgi:hypothetical protein
MADLRKPTFILLLRKSGKRKGNKVEMFRASLWDEHWNDPGNPKGRWRLRVNGKWFPKGEMKFFTKTQVKELFFRELK